VLAAQQVRAQVDLLVDEGKGDDSEDRQRA
jgi:hypothetical protein